jgi:hypothetical protein
MRVMQNPNDNNEEEKDNNYLPVIKIIKIESKDK